MRLYPRSRHLVFTTALLLGGLALLPPERGTAVPGEQKLYATDIQSMSSFGDSVAVSGDLCIVGSPLHKHDPLGTLRAGSAYPFERIDGEWVGRELRPPEPENLQSYGWAVECTADVGLFPLLFVGAPGTDTEVAGGGAVFVYERGSGGWSLVQTLVPRAPRQAARFGFSLALDGERLVVGAPGDDEVRTDFGAAGAAYLFHYSDGQWRESEKFLPVGDGPVDAGWDVDISGNLVVVGAPATFERETFEGAVFTYRDLHDGWGGAEPLYRYAGDRGRFGWAVGIDGDHLIASALFTGNGEVYSYFRGTGGWESQGSLPRTTAGNRQQFGSSIAIDGSRALIGASSDNTEDDGAGAVYEYQRVGQFGAWEDQGRLSSEDDTAYQYYGVSVGMDGPRTIVGAPNDSSRQSSAGAAYLTGYGDPPVPVIRSFLLPTKLDVNVGAGKMGASKAPKPTVKSSGIFDTGPEQMDFTATADVQIGPTTLKIPGLTRKRGRKEAYTYSDQGLSLTVTPSSYGTSKARYKLSYTGNLAGPVDPNGKFTLRYTGSVADAEGSVQLEGGKFRFAGKAGLLLAPELDIRKAKAKLPNVGRHQFKFVAGFTTEGQVPAQAPTCRVRFGTIFSADLPGTTFERKKNGDWVLGERVGGVTHTIMSYVKERITVKAKDVDIGNVPDGPAPLLLVLTLGDDERAVEVRAVRKGKIFKY